MGISGLLLALKPMTVTGNIRDYAGQPIAIDASSWLHKSVYSIADHYVECMERNALDRRCIDTSSHYIIQRCQELLKHAGISKLYLVLDGKRCPLKAVTNAERETRRSDNLRQARKWKHTNPHQSNEKYKACIKVTDELTKRVVRTIEQTFRDTADTVEMVWSPYEADAQLVQLAVDGRVKAIITEDSDVLVYSAARQIVVPVLYKLDRHTGQCDVVSMEWLLSNTKTTHAPLPVLFDILKSRQQRYPGWGSRLFVQSCVLAGCDYAPRQLNGVGYITALKLVKNASTSPAQISKVLSTILTSQLKPKARQAIPDMHQFEILLAQSEAVFYYHPVVDANGSIQHLLPIHTPASNHPHNLDEQSSSSALAPSLDRFENPFEFLGSLVANANANAGIIPPAVPTSHRNANSLFRHNRHPDNNKENHPPSLPAQKTILNPYHRPSRPLVVVDNNQENHNNKQNNSKGNKCTTQTKVNPFESYARRHREVGIQDINAKYSMRRQGPIEKTTILDFYYNKEDVRYVKRTFPKQQQQCSTNAPTPECKMLTHGKTSEANRPDKASSLQLRSASRTLLEPNRKTSSPLRVDADSGDRQESTHLEINRDNSFSNHPVSAIATKEENPITLVQNHVNTTENRDFLQHDTESLPSEAAELSKPESHRLTSRFFAQFKHPRHVEQEHQANVPAAFDYEAEDDDQTSLSSNQSNQNIHQDQTLFQTCPSSNLLNSPDHRKTTQQDDDIGCVRRVTMELLPEIADVASQPKHHQVLWDIYEDCHLKTPRDKEIVDLSGTDEDELSPLEDHSQENTHNRCISVADAPKVQSTIGPAKTFRERYLFNFGKPPEQKKKGILERLLHRQRSTKNQDQPKKRALHFAFVDEPNKHRRSNTVDLLQQSLHSHFAPRNTTAGKTIFSDHDDI
jgi:exonuclease-1